MNAEERNLRGSDSSQGELWQRQLQYWREQLSGAPEVLKLPLDRPRPAVGSHDVAVSAFTLPVQLSDQLKAFARTQGATLYMVLLGAFQVLLSRYSGQLDVVVGCPVAGRTYARLEGLMDSFVNTLPLRLRLQGKESFAEVVKQVRQRALGACAHQDIPFERLVAELQPRQDLALPPVFQVMFVLHKQPRAALYPPGVARVSSKFDLTLSLREGPLGITGGLEYAAALFDAETIQAMTRSYECLLREFVVDPTKSVFNCRLMSRSEERRQLRQGKGRTREYPTSRIHEQFESQVRRTPNSVALVYRNLSLTYGQLNELAGRLSRHLREAGVGAGIRVGIHLERSLEQLIAVLGVMKAGGTYVPLEVGLPNERLTFLLEDAQIKHVLLLEESMQSLSLSAIEVVLMDGAATQTDWLRKYADQPSAVVSEPAFSRPAEDEALYVLYTSGSTGKPKGVVVGHREVSNYLAYAGRAYLSSEIEAAVVSTPLSFDATLTTLLAPLLVGKTVRLLSHQAGFLEELSRELFESEKPRLFKLTPAHLQALRHAAEASPTRTVAHRIVVGGEQLSVATLEPWIRSLPLARFVNEYGPTETVVGCCVYELSGLKGLEALGGAAVVPIGRAIANTQLYVLGENRRLRPSGCVGELYIAGAGVTRGYLNRADLTDEHFVENPYDSGRRLYRSGDRVRWRPQGVLEFVGRVDDQVKLRGYRIELGEIEAALQSHPEVRQAAVVLHEEAGGARRLIGYVVSEKERGPSATQLHDYLERTLPDYMVPAQYLRLGRMPLTGNGKVDRTALPAPGPPNAPQEPAPPLTPTELALEKLWRKVLRIEGRVGVHDNFFERGGDSILAINLMAQATKAGLKLTIPQIFESPTIAELALLLTAAHVGDAEQGNRTL